LYLDCIFRCNREAASEDSGGGPPASGLADDDLEDAGQRDSPQFSDLGRYRVGPGDDGGEELALASDISRASR
jgi:hypothetical protein